ncbi:hypothetical protein SD70_02885 [Gordoniibacillus kamchatkensis]|uniref:Uncharacterized protein n=2 Tax=Gordoniibacillus kamchatkensis TaxID=1590651 RepID=A0ABR5AM77_9BACL|nr:hypothetical protein SD70_02885 [Paenibacillus sp. VKM B-2647]
MNMNALIEASVWVISVLLLLIFVPRANVREAWISYIFLQLPTWFFGLAAVQWGLIIYPSRFFDKAVSTSFTYEFLALPVISAVFNLHYPKTRSFWPKIVYILAFPTILTLVEVILERNTLLVAYIKWTGYYSWITIAFTLLLGYWFYKWFAFGSLHSFGKR